MKLPKSLSIYIMAANSNLLIDTHVLLWWLADDDRLSPDVSSRISKGGNSIIVSPATAWEIEIKRAMGKLDCPDDLEQQIAASAFAILPITLRHATVAGRLPLHHKDPFDRLLIAQAQVEGLTILTADERIGAYDIDVMRI